MAVFKDYAAYYDLLYKDKDYEGEAEYILNIIKSYNRDSKSILNLGCGTGRHDCLFADRGYMVMGIDISHDMIEIANSKLKYCLNTIEPVFRQGDLLSLNLNQKFDIVTALFHVMSYQTSNEDLDKAFISAFKHLNDDGVFIFDCWYGPGVLTDRPYLKEKWYENDLYKVKRVSTSVIYPNENCVDVKFQMNIFNKESHKRFDLEEVHKMRYLFYPEIKSISERLGFQILHSETWMSGAALSFSSWNAVFVCKKK